MITCPNCAKENQDHYKFCLGCGSKLPAQAAAPAAAAEPTPPRLGSPAPTNRPGAAPVGSTGTAPGTRTPPQQSTATAAGSDTHGSPPAPTTASPGPCWSCGMVNPPGFAFCGRCGARLTGAEPSKAGDVGSANTIFVDQADEVPAPPASAPSTATAPSGPTAPSPAEPPPPPASAPAPAAPAAPVAPAAPGPSVTGAGPAAHVVAAAPVKPPPAGAGSGKDAPGGPSSSGGSNGAPRGVPGIKLIMLGPDGQPVGERSLGGGESLEIGRSSGPPWDDDAYLDPRHATLTTVENGMSVIDHSSLNGIYVKLDDRVEVRDGDQFRVGQELLAYYDLPEPTPADDGTEQMGSPNPGYWGRVDVLVEPGRACQSFTIDGEGVTIGRETGEITFPEDGYVSGTHCRISGDDSGVYVEDMGSSNGTYMRVRSGDIVPYGALVLIGQKLFQIDKA